ncbi:hypothetical protein CJI55_05920 [Gardnerella vaginalis]|nr:hypothetical protein CJI55_05920 [Gardnerella vaginalis]
MFNNLMCAKSFEPSVMKRELGSASTENIRNTLSPRLVRVACGFDAVRRVSACTVIIGGILRHYRVFLSCLRAHFYILACRN